MPAPIMDPMQEDACLAVFVGTTPVGQACIYTNECERGAGCVSDKAADAASPRYLVTSTRDAKSLSQNRAVRL